MHLLRKGVYEDISHIILISNKLVSKVSAQKKGGEVMTATNISSNFGGKCYSPAHNYGNGCLGKILWRSKDYLMMKTMAEDSKFIRKNTGYTSDLLG